MDDAVVSAGRVYPGYGDWVGREGAIPVPSQDHPKDPYYTYSKAKALPTAK